MLRAEKESCLLTTAAHGMEHLPIKPGCSPTSISDEGITDTQAMSLHPYLVLVGSCPQPLSFHGHAGAAVPEPPLPPAAPTGVGGTGWGVDAQTGTT